MQTVHALAHYLAARRTFAAYVEATVAAAGPEEGATHITFTVTVLAEPFFRTWMEVALKKGWAPAAEATDLPADAVHADSQYRRGARSDRRR